MHELGRLVPLEREPVGPGAQRLDALGGAGRFLPGRAGQQVMPVGPDGALGPWSGLGAAAA
ncbi:hypothetical protein ACSNOK_28920 [Streptomyces sp. URMC 126]|uniref:hypothetical protein n=1 Tax=Streptomyces sp. URMC 126 TaxID=3423401 RepID=UPI003F19EBF1